MVGRRILVFSIIVYVVGKGFSVVFSLSSSTVKKGKSYILKDPVLTGEKL